MDKALSFLVQTQDQGLRLDSWLHEQVQNLSRSRIKALIEEGHVRVQDKKAVPSQKIKEGDQVTLFIPEPEEALPVPSPMALDIIFEDEDILVLNKPPGLVVHPACGHWQDTLVNGLLAYCGSRLSGIGGVKRPGIVHRLDKGTSGLMVVAKNDLAHEGLSQQFATRSLSRSYQALVWGTPKLPKGTVHTLLGRSPHHRQKMAVLTRGGKEATTDYHLMTTYKGYISLIKCTLHTGRTHQIRVHMSHLGHGLLGDPLYGHAPKGTPEALKALCAAFKDQERPLLHAYQLHLLHPRSHEMMTFETPLHDHLQGVIDLLETQPSATIAEAI